MARPTKRLMFDIEVDNLTMAETLAEIERLVSAGRPAMIVTPNAQHISLLRTDSDFQAVYQAANLIVADGIPLVWISRLLGRPLKERIAGSDILPAFAGLAAQKRYRLFFLGAAPGIAALAAKILAHQHPGLNVVQTLSPPLGFHRDDALNAEVVASIRKARPDILFVGLGTPKGEVWAWRNKDAAGVPVTVCVGAAFDFITGLQKRAPLLIQRLGLEWLFRFLHDPRRLLKRYTFGNLHFLYLSILELFSPSRPSQKKT